MATTIYQVDTKSSKYYYYILESESTNSSSGDDTESIYSLQGKTTDIVKDTTDTDSKSDDEVEVEIEYEIASSSTESDQDNNSVTSSEPEDVMLAAAAICDSSLEAFVTDAEDSDNSQQEDSSGHSLFDFYNKCIQCNSNNDNRQYRYCDKCYQDRKTTFPVRPRRYKKTKKNNKTTDKITSTSSSASSSLLPRSTSPVKLDTLKSCLNSLSHDSGVGSSQDLPELSLDEIYVPSTSSSQEQKQNEDLYNNKNRKRQYSESSLSEFEMPQIPKKLRNSTIVDNQKKQEDIVNNNDNINNVNITKSDNVNLDECKEMCIICQNAPKNSVFLHGRIAHMCCCYKCAMRTWKNSKRCPICNRRSNSVVKVFKS